MKTSVLRVASSLSGHSVHFAFDGLMASLERTVRTLQPPKQQTEWGEYYSFTNYSDTAFKEKQKVVKNQLAAIKPVLQRPGIWAPTTVSLAGLPPIWAHTPLPLILIR